MALPWLALRWADCMPLPSYLQGFHFALCKPNGTPAGPRGMRSLPISMSRLPLLQVQDSEAAARQALDAARRHLAAAEGNHVAPGGDAAEVDAAFDTFDPPIRSVVLEVVDHFVMPRCSAEQWHRTAAVQRCYQPVAPVLSPCLQALCLCPFLKQAARPGRHCPDQAHSAGRAAQAGCRGAASWWAWHCIRAVRQVGRAAGRCSAGSWSRRPPRLQRLSCGCQASVHSSNRRLNVVISKHAEQRIE